ncbi:ABC transporter permease [Fulvivirga lutimaris]|uniref:ABC transporter permease n=1 Tax=Fulvivirga lutimaris TaxID=1819566 RepID=UPI0012BBB984|nr:ABC transporter permease [Fulvivirga lutimaris]MTI39296.1 ABC transporter permease [Fulvivirga lutimaris]
MLTNYIKIAFRNIWKAKLHSFITFTGLSTGIACCLLIILFVKDEWTFDDFHSKADRIYRGWTYENYGENETFFNTVTPYPLGPALKDNYSEVEDFVRINNLNLEIKVGEDSFNEQVTVAGQSFFDFFDFESILGKPSLALDDKNAAILTERMSQKLFGLGNPIGQNIAMDIGDGQRLFTVKSVVANMPTNTSISFDIMISDLNNDVMVSERAMNAWYNVNPETYFLLTETANAEDIIAKTPALLKNALGENYVEGEYQIGLQPLLDIHLNNEMPVGIAPVSDPKYAYILVAIAGLILLLGCINFVTLSVSKSINRAREVGVRKVVGARRNQLMSQFLSEAVVTAFISVIIGLFLSALSLNLFNELSGKQLLFEFDAVMALSVILLLVVIGIISGSYPALLLSGLKPVSILKGSRSNAGNKQGLRRALVAIQFVLTIFLISTTLLMQDQLSFLQSKNLGFDKEQVIVSQINVEQSGGLIERVGKGMESAQLMLNELDGKEGVVTAGAANHTFGSGGWTNVGFTDTQDNYKTFDMLVTDAHFIQSMKMKMVEGRAFDQNNLSDGRRAVIINEAFADAFGFDDPIGKQLPGKNFEDHEIIGVIENFNYNSLHAEVEPLLMTMSPGIIFPGIENVGIGSNPFPKLFVRLEANKLQEGIASMKTVWEKVTNGEEFEYDFVDQTLATQYSSEQNLSKIVSIASILAIVIGCMGLFALASLNMENRTKEVSIRKVLGASQSLILTMLSKEYIILILISLVISVPLTLYVIDQWLASFAYRVEVGAGVFALTGGLTLVIALITISYNAIKVSLKQPAETLKYE